MGWLGGSWLDLPEGDLRRDQNWEGFVVSYGTGLRQSRTGGRGDSCYRLLSKGRFQGSNIWQPYGCMIHSYSHEDSRRCMRYAAFLKQDNHIALVGDSRIRQLYYSLVRQVCVSPVCVSTAVQLFFAQQITVSPSSEETLPTDRAAYHEDLHYQEHDLRLRIDFYWHTKIDQTVLSRVHDWKAGSPPSLLVFGSGLHYIRDYNGSSEALHDYTSNITLLVESAESLPETSHVLWMLQEPVLPERLEQQKAHITNRLIDQYNRAAMQVLSPSRVQVWSSARLIAQGSLSDFADGMHAGRTTVTSYIQILLNLYCNNYLNFDDGSCCNTREGFTTTQITSFVALCTCSAIMICLSLKQWLAASHQNGHSYIICPDTQLLGSSTYDSGGFSSNSSGEVSSSGSSCSPARSGYVIVPSDDGLPDDHNEHHGASNTQASQCYESVSKHEGSRGFDGGVESSGNLYQDMNLNSYSSTAKNESGLLCTSGHNLQQLPQQQAAPEPQKPNSSVQIQPSLQTILRALGKLGLIMGYFFLCDRTGLFMKENKYFSQLNFWFPLGYMLALGLFFTEDTSHTRILHRDMTDEWKGWMQLVILVYHMTGGSQKLPIYLHVRIFVSAYLFLTGFGHFSYAWSGRDMGVVRYCQIMFRMNFLTVLLCLVMNRPYQFYYFVPLVSFWYTVIYVTLVLPPVLLKPRANNNHITPNAPTVNYLYSIVKFVGLAGFITLLFLSEVFFEKVFVLRPWKALFVTTDDDIHEWWFRWQLDRHSVLYGAVFALLYRAALQFGMLDDTSNGNLVTGRLAGLLAVLATACVGSYGVLVHYCGNKRDCNQVHPYIVWIPILGYIILRNQLGMLRTRYSSFFAWFGRISLELFVCQYHIWLAADTHGVLVLVPSYPVANVLLTSFIFLCVAQEIFEITNVLLPFFVPNNPWRAVRNLSIFLFVLLTLAIHDGIF
ncbi:Cas1p 10 TM acyl transferase domain [Trinorchestia longiramus]|nr:Cas1p 10 TM acyl transferase domain [Trinorchestia longiramus]